MEEENLIIHSKWNMASYSIGDFIMQTFAFTFTAYVFFFYEVEVGLDSWLVGLGFPCDYSEFSFCETRIFILDEVFSETIFF